MSAHAKCLLVLGASVLPALFATPVAAQRGWEPVVATVEPGRIEPPSAGIKPQSAAPRRKLVPSSAIKAFMATPHLMERAPKAAAVEPAAQRTPKAPEVVAPHSAMVQNYCANIAKPAAEARFAWQKKALADIERELDERIAVLETKAAELQKWVTRRDEFIDKARASLVSIYSRMRPDAAAMQLMAMDEETASAVLLKLEPRTASLILNEMDPTRAARLTTIVSGAARAGPPKGPQAIAEEKKS